MDIDEVLEIQIPRTLLGVGAVNRIGDVVKSLGPSRPLIVTGPTVAKTGIIDIVQAALGAAGVEAAVFDRCAAEAPVSVIEQLTKTIRDGGYDLLIGVGGGSVLDTTKTAGLLAANEGVSVADFLAHRPPAESLRKVLVPTTAGTGSEWSPIAVVTTDTTDDRSCPFHAPRNLPEAVIIDPALTKDLPAKITAETGVDALAHAIEAYTCCRASVVSDMYAATAIGLIADSLGPAYAKGTQRLGDRYRLSVAAASAMLAGSIAGAGLAHFMNHALGKKAGISHGATVGLMLPYVMEYNLVSDPAKFAELARLLGEDTAGMSTWDAAERSVAAVRRLLATLGMPQRLGEVGVTAADIPALVEELMALHPFPMTYMNARDVGPEDATSIYRRAL